MQLFVKTTEGRTLCVSFDNNDIGVGQLKTKLEQICGIPTIYQRLSCCCKELRDEDKLGNNYSVQVDLRLLGGKGGFGALLRGAGARAGQKKPSNYDDCRDLNGNRIRHVKHEKKIADWYASSKEREEDEANKRRKKQEEQLAKNPPHQFDSTRYVNSMKEIQGNIEAAVEEALKTSAKKEIEPEEEPPSKKIRKGSLLWTEFDDIYEEPKQLQNNEGNEHPSEGVKEASNGKVEVKKDEPIDLEKFSSAEELESVGLDTLKKELARLGLLCGGTLKQRAERLFSIKGKDFNSLDPKLFAKRKNDSGRA